VDYDILQSLPEEAISFESKIRPILERRCTVCHGCYDAPCQLKLSSPAGILRGANKEKVYETSRIKPVDPTRLFIDATTTEEWRQKNFFPVINEGEIQNPEENLKNSLIYRMLRLKERYPQPRTGMIPKDIDISLDRKQTCPELRKFDKYTKKHPLEGMPFALPNLSKEEYTVLVQWLAQMAPVTSDKAPSNKAARQIKKWEAFLNGQSNKEKLVGRYIFEHLFHAHLHFDGTDNREFYRMIRSSTPSDEPVNVITTRRPYGETAGPIYYRIIRHQGSIVAKDHLAYTLSDKRLRRVRQLFIDPEYEVPALPSYDKVIASNPIKAFESLPPGARYRFLLDNARFYIEGFIKGPVCRGQVALNVIEDQFWIFFFNPDKPPLSSKEPEFLQETADYLQMPGELEDNFKLLAGKKHYKKLMQKYEKIKTKYSNKLEPTDIVNAMNYLWDGDGHNPNAALTVFRHFDSASVNFGLIGDYPETAWILDYSLLERIHYLLVASYDVYGNVGHQLNTRLYMDFLRMEAEDYFLAFLPAAKRKEIHDSWYMGIRRKMKKDISPDDWIGKEYVTGYTSPDPQRELYQHMERRLGPVAGGEDFINRCNDNQCNQVTSNSKILRADRAMRQATKLNGIIVKYLPDTAFVRVKMGGRPEDDLAYTMISNKAYTNVKSMFKDEKRDERRDYNNDTQTIVRWLEGAYPNFFYVVDIDEIEAFVESYNEIETRDDYEKFVARFGVRRTNVNFWAISDWFMDQYAREQPVLSGIFDLNRYENR